MTVINLRSDTVTRPTDKMMEAPVGDDVYKENPTVNLLEEKTGAITGKETALFAPPVPSPIC